MHAHITLVTVQPPPPVIHGIDKNLLKQASGRCARLAKIHKVNVMLQCVKRVNTSRHKCHRYHAINMCTCGAKGMHTVATPRTATTLHLAWLVCFCQKSRRAPLPTAIRIATRTSRSMVSPTPMSDLRHAKRPRALAAAAAADKLEEQKLQKSEETRLKNSNRSSC